MTRTTQYNSIPADRLILPSRTVQCSIVDVDADSAARWLATDRRNRPLNATWVSRYRDDITSGLWLFAADPIRFDWDGHLLDGQHRLTALLGLDVALPTLVVLGLDPDSQLVMDQGRKRSAGQQLSMLGIKYAHQIASSMKAAILHETGMMFRDNKLAQTLTNPIIQAYVAGRPAEVEFLQELMSDVQTLDCAPSPVGAFLIDAHRKGRADEAAHFIRRLVSLTDLSTGDPILALDRRLRRLRQESPPSNRDIIALFIQAFNASAEGRTMNKFQRPHGSSWTPETFPVISPH